MNLLAELEEFVGDYRPRRSSVRSTRLRLPCGALTAAHSCPPGRSSASNARRRLTRLAPAAVCLTREVTSWDAELDLLRAGVAN